MTLSERKPICFYCVASHMGGAERSTLDLIKEMARSDRYEPWALLPSPKGGFAEALKAAGIRTEFLPLPGHFFKVSRDKPFRALVSVTRSSPELGLYFMRFVRLLRKNRTSLIHTTGIKCHLIAAFLLPLHRRPVLWHIRDILVRGPVLATFKSMQRTARRGFPGRLQTVYLTDAAAAPFAIANPLVLNDGFDPNDYSTTSSRFLHQKLSLPEVVPLVGILGVLARWKGQLEFIEMGRRLIASGSPAHFVIIGGRIYDTVSDLDYEKELRSAANATGTPDRFHFTGYLPQPLEALRSLKVLVHASTRPEPFGRVIVEAMASGVPVVASGAGGVLEIIRPESNGLLFEPCNTVEMAEQVQRLLTDPALARSIVEQARPDFERKYTIRSHVLEIQKVYDEMITE